MEVFPYLSLSLLPFSVFAFLMSFFKEQPELQTLFNVQTKPRLIDSIKMFPILLSFFPLTIFMSLFAFSVWLSTQMIFAVNYSQ